MADADKQIRVQIELDKTGSGGEAAQAELAAISGAQKTTADTTQKVGTESEKAAEKVKLFSGEGREMHRVIGELNRISPLLGEALRVAMHPVGGTIAAAIGLFVLMKEHIKEVNKELDDMAEAAAKPEFLEGIRAKQAALREAADAAQDYAQHIADIAASETTVTAQLTAQLALQKSIDEARSAQASAEESLAQAKIKALVGEGKLSPEEGEAAGAGIKRKAEADALRAKQAAQDKEVSSKTAALEGLDVAGDQANARALMETYGKEKARREQTEKDFGDAAYDRTQSSDEDGIRRAQTQLDRAGDDKVREMQENLRTNQNEFQRENLRERIKEIQSSPDYVQAETFHRNATHVQQLHEEGRGQFLRDQQSEPEFNALKIAMDEAKKKADDTTKAEADLTAQLKALTDAITANRGTENATLRTKQETSFFDEAAGLGRDVNKTGEFLQHLGEGKRVDPAEGHAALKEAQGTTRALVQAVKDAGASHSAALAELVAELDRQRAQMAAIAAQFGMGRNIYGGG